MSLLHKCDGCGKLSPQGNTFLHNHWTLVTYTMQTPHGGKDTVDMEFCERCLPVEEAVVERVKEILAGRIHGVRTKVGKWR
jgi:hypothetical protein